VRLVCEWVLCVCVCVCVCVWVGGWSVWQAGEGGGGEVWEGERRGLIRNGFLILGWTISTRTASRSSGSIGSAWTRITSSCGSAGGAR